MKKLFSIVFFLLISALLFAQNKLVITVTDSTGQEKLQGVSIAIVKTKKGGTTDSSGKLILNNIPDGKQAISFSIIGYKAKTVDFVFPLDNPEVTIIMEKAEEEKMEEVIVSSSRTESRIENLPTKVEVLGAEEVSEEVGIKPGSIASLLGDVAGIQTQQTSAATGNTEMRVQGLPGKYTQILKDGMPLFGGYSGSFSILQIPPLDLKQIEIVKGASSTLYGGGAIAGMINLISKKPKEGEFEKTILLNQTSLKESNVNVYLSNRKNKFGYTFFTGLNYQKAVDVNKDGFSDVPDVKGYFIHPTFFFYPNNKNSISIGYNGVFEDRNGGDMLVLKDKGDNQHQYFDRNKSYRNTVDATWENKINSKDRFNFKATGSWLDRAITTNTFGMRATQFSYYSEASWLKRFDKNDLVAGINFTGENFAKKQPDSTQISNYNYSTIGGFVQDDWRFAKSFTLQTGLRIDHHNQYGNFVLPRFSLLYKINSYFTSRLGAGMGYKIPTVFSSDVDEREYPLVLPLNNASAEKSLGANWDINYHRHVNAWDITVNQTFYVTSIKHPLVLYTDASGNLYLNNADKPITTTGFETYVQLHHDKLEIYLGYTYTVAKKLYDDTHPYLSLSARNKFASVLAYEFTSRFRAGLESAFTGRQYLDDGSRTPAYPFVAAMLRYDISKFSFVLNCENLFDYRQTKQENIVIPPLNNPYFKQLWAPIDGRVVNFSVRIKL
ncbi:MAG: TonB-dependent receptor [Bacteroidetes bacterium]|nr:TonB-dependent receptor [Bacteroidota bacterium]